MNKCQISDLIDFSDTHSSSSLSCFDDIDDDPNWENDDIDNRGENYRSEEEKEVTSEWIGISEQRGPIFSLRTFAFPEPSEKRRKKKISYS
jgi:hypothetical protein